MCSKFQWDRARRSCYQRAGYVCEICDNVGPNHPVECHEHWEWEPTGIQRLTKLIALCPMCHHAVHIGHSMMSTTVMHDIFVMGEKYIELIQHMAKVNGVSMDEVRKRLKWHRERYILHNNDQWKVNVDLVKYFKERPFNVVLGGFKL